MEILNSFAGPMRYSEDTRFGELLRASRELGGNYDNQMTRLINLYNDPEAETGDIQAATLKFEKAKAILEMFSTMAKSMFDTIMSIIRKLS